MGTSVGAYLRTQWRREIGGAPEGAAVASATVASDGSLAFSGLAADSDYVAYVGSPDRYVRFRTSRIETHGGYGPLSDMNALTGVQDGFTWFASDEGVEYVYYSGTWHRHDLGELDYEEKKDAAFSPAVASGRVDITGLAPITFDVEEGWVVAVELYCGWVTGGGVGTNGVLYIADNAGAVKSEAATGVSFDATTRKLGQVSVRERITEAGSYTRKGQAQSFLNPVNFQAGDGTALPPITLAAHRVR